VVRRDVLLQGVNDHITERYVFFGALSGDVITGTLTFSGEDRGPGRVGTSLVPMAVTLSR
jgi:hypothetical protein